MTWFRENYTKLKLNIFHSVRPKDYMKRNMIEIGIYEKITTPDNNFQAKPIATQIIAIEEIPLSFLKIDADPVEINSHQDFVDLLNSFNTKFSSNRLTTKKMIIWWKRKPKVAVTKQRSLKL